MRRRSELCAFRFEDLDTRHKVNPLLHLRRSELCAFKFEDLEVGHDSKPILHLRKSKADQESIGRIIPISNELGNLIETWRDKIDVDSGFILRAIDKHGNVSSQLSPGSITIILNSIARGRVTSQNQCQYFSGHSFRVGAALDLLIQGEILDRIMIKGGWKSEESALRYLQQISY